MTRAPRRSLVAAALLLLSACASAGGGAKLRSALDARPVPRACADLWPDALRVLDQHGFPLVGDDPKLIGKPPQTAWSRVLAKGHETGALGEGGFVAETDANRAWLRYRVEARPAAQGACRVSYTRIQGGEHGTPNEDAEERDPELELELLRKVDPARADEAVAAAKK